MADKWFAECLPCKWEERYDTETDALTAASQHVQEKHLQSPPEQRGTQKMGHVQFRTELAVAAPLPTGDTSTWEPTAQPPAEPTVEQQSKETAILEPTAQPPTEPTVKHQSKETSKPPQYSWQATKHKGK